MRRHQALCNPPPPDRSIHTSLQSIPPPFFPFHVQLEVRGAHLLPARRLGDYHDAARAEVRAEAQARCHDALAASGSLSAAEREVLRWGANAQGQWRVFEREGIGRLSRHVAWHVHGRPRPPDWSGGLRASGCWAALDPASVCRPLTPARSIPTAQHSSFLARAPTHTHSPPLGDPCRRRASTPGRRCDQPTDLPQGHGRGVPVWLPARLRAGPRRRAHALAALRGGPAPGRLITGVYTCCGGKHRNDDGGLIGKGRAETRHARLERGGRQNEPRAGGPRAGSRGVSGGELDPDLGGHGRRVAMERRGVCGLHGWAGGLGF